MKTILALLICFASLTACAGDIVFIWDANPVTDQVLGYRLYRLDAGEVWTKIHETEGASTVTAYDPPAGHWAEHLRRGSLQRHGRRREIRFRHRGRETRQGPQRKREMNSTPRSQGVSPLPVSQGVSPWLLLLGAAVISLCLCACGTHRYRDCTKEACTPAQETQYIFDELNR